MHKPNRYTIEKNDLKYRNMRNINPENVEWTAEMRELFDTIDFDSIEYRIYECEKKTDGRIFDASNIDLKRLPESIFRFSDTLQYLFINNNYIDSLPDIERLVNLEVIDISNNNISVLGTLPKSLIELSCRSNHLTRLPDPSTIPALLRIDCTQNNISFVPQYDKLTLLVCSNNKISDIESMSNLQTLMCDNNRLHILREFPKLCYIDCSNNLLRQLAKQAKLVDLLCNNNPIRELPVYDCVKYIEILGTDITELPFMRDLIEVFCNRDRIKCISETYTAKYNIKLTVNNKTILHMFFDAKS